MGQPSIFRQNHPSVAGAAAVIMFMETMRIEKKTTLGYIIGV